MFFNLYVNDPSSSHTDHSAPSVTIVVNNGLIPSASNIGTVNVFFKDSYNLTVDFTVFTDD